jgi:hypothetical protein
MAGQVAKPILILAAIMESPVFQGKVSFVASPSGRDDGRKWRPESCASEVAASAT